MVEETVTGGRFNQARPLRRDRTFRRFNSERRNGQRGGWVLLRSAPANAIGQLAPAARGCLHRYPATFDNQVTHLTDIRRHWMRQRSGGGVTAPMLCGSRSHACRKARVSFNRVRTFRRFMKREQADSPNLN